MLNVFRFLYHCLCCFASLSVGTLGLEEHMSKKQKKKYMEICNKHTKVVRERILFCLYEKRREMVMLKEEWAKRNTKLEGQYMCLQLCVCLPV